MKITKGQILRLILIASATRRDHLWLGGMSTRQRCELLNTILAQQENIPIDFPDIESISNDEDEDVSDRLDRLDRLDPSDTNPVSTLQLPCSTDDL